MSHIFLENSPILFANNFCKLNCTIYFIRRNFLAINLNKYWQKIIFAKKQYQNEYVTLILNQIGDISSKWNHANTYTRSGIVVSIWLNLHIHSFLRGMVTTDQWPPSPSPFVCIISICILTLRVENFPRDLFQISTTMSRAFH